MTATIKLVKSGGLVGNKMSATAPWNFSDADWNELVAAIQRPETTSKARDTFHYSIQKNGDADSRVPISIQNIPAKFNAVFKDLFEGMKPEKGV